jgi:hypothetical protein
LVGDKNELAHRPSDHGGTYRSAQETEFIFWENLELIEGFVQRSNVA